MKLAQKIIMLIMLQITIIIASFLIVAYLESEKTLAGHTINIAGKNRVLTSQVEIEIYRFVLSNVTPGSLDESTRIDGVLGALSDLDANIHTLKHGGTAPDAKILPLPDKFYERWQEVTDKFWQYNDMVSSMATNYNFTIQNVRDVEQVGIELIVLSNALTEELSNDLELFSLQMVILQILLGIGNVAIHVVMIWLILRILRTREKERIKEEKFLVLGEFASMLSHDMRNPLGTINNSIRLISKDINDDRGRKEVNRINRSIRRMTHQIEDVLNYVHVPKLDLKSHSLSNMLETCIRDMEIPDNITINLPAKNTAINCDADKMEFVFANLILNAIQAIGNSPGHITIIVKESSEQVTIVVVNSGEPIQGDIEKIFEPLYTTKMQGTGLGLASCKNIISAHKGVISASNNPTRFTITMPGRAGH